MKKIKIAGWFVFLLMFCVSCLDTSVDDIDGGNTTDRGWMAFINASPGSQQLKLFSNDQGLSNSLNYDEFNAYMGVGVGTVSISVRSGNQDDLDVTSVNIEKGKYYSMFAVNDADETELAFYEDNLDLPQDHFKTVFRYIQLSADMPRAILKIEGVADDFGSFSFKQPSAFIELNAFEDKIISLTDEVTGEVLVSKKVSFGGQRAYSVFTQGIPDSTDPDQKLEIKIIPYN